MPFPEVGGQRRDPALPSAGVRSQTRTSRPPSPAPRHARTRRVDVALGRGVARGAPGLVHHSAARYAGEAAARSGEGHLRLRRARRRRAVARGLLGVSVGAPAYRHLTGVLGSRSVTFGVTPGLGHWCRAAVKLRRPLRTRCSPSSSRALQRALPEPSLSEPDRRPP